MVRRTGHGAEAPGANGTRDIRSFFSMKAQSALAASEAIGEHDNDISVSPSQSSGSALPNGSALVSTQARDSKAQRQPAHKSKRPAMTQDENRSPATEGSNDTSASGSSLRRTPASSGHLNTSTSLSELHTTPTLPPSAMRSILRTPGRQGSGTRINNENSAHPTIPPSGSATGSPWKGVRWNSEPEVSTPKRNLWPSGRRTKVGSSCESAASLLPDSTSLKSGLILGTPKRDGTELSISNGTPGSQLSLPDLRSSPSIPSSTSSTKKRPALARDAVIKGSDYEDSDDSLSDCSLPDLDMLLPTKSRADISGTPKAKRRARMVHKSPLTIQPKHKFDFKTLDAHSKRHDVLFDSPKRATGANVKDEPMGDMEASPSKARLKLIEIAGVKAEEDADKALKAIERTYNSGSRTRWYFFTKDAVTGEDAVPFPKSRRSMGPWSFLERARTRDQHIMSGMPTRLADSVGLPDELYLWALDMMNTEKVSVLREEYCRLAAANKAQVKRLVTPQRLEGVFRKLGAADYVGDETLKPVRQVRDIYAGRDWAALRSYLKWLHNIGRYLEYDATVYAVKMLLRMAADSMILENPDVLMGHQCALAALVNNVDDDTWSEFCTEICSSLYHGFDKSSLRILPLACMPVASPKLHELRRRLAVAFFLRDAALASELPDDVMSLRLVIARVKDSDFQINRKTDFADLRARVQLLDMAVDDGSFVPDKDDREHEKSFNAEIDDLSRRLKAIWRGINDTGAANLARTEAKSVLEWVGQRLTYAVRTKPPPTQSIFGEQGPSSAKKRRQQVFMQKFVHARKFKQAQSETKEEPSSGEDDTFVTAYG